MEITLKDFAYMLLVLSEEIPELGNLQLSVDDIMRDCIKGTDMNGDVSKMLELILKGAASIRVERECQEFRKELENL